MQRIFVTGATGFVGHAVVRALVAHGFLVRCLVRPGSEAALKGFESIDRVPGDVLEPDKLAASVEGCGAVVNLVGIIREHRARGITFDRLHTQATANMLAVAHEASYEEAVGEERPHHGVPHEARGARYEDQLHDGRIVARGAAIFAGRRPGRAAIMEPC